MIEIGALRQYCESLLDADRTQDYCPNGLQVEGDRAISRLLTGVTACQALVDEAVAWRADALLVHHGYFWKGEPQPLTGIKGRRVRTLMRAGISLFAYHLPLDAHAQLGNNRCLGDRLGLQESQSVSDDGLLWCGRLAEPCPGWAFREHIARTLAQMPIHIAAHSRPIARLAWCTGAAQDWIERAAELDVDAFLSGEISERTTHQARELGLDYFAAGHHATERYGVQALGDHLAERFHLEHRFVDIPNPA